MPTLYAKQPPLVGGDIGNYLLGTARNGSADDLREHPTEAAHAGARRYSAGHYAADGGEPRTGDQHLSPTATTELVAVPPRGEFGSEWFSDAHELSAVTQLGEPDVVRGRAQTRIPIETLRLFDRLPALLERREVPPLALRTHDPQPPLRRVVRQPPSDGKRVEGLVLAERAAAEEASRVHRCE